MAIAYFGSGSGTGAGGTTTVISTPASIPAGAIIVITMGGFCTSATPTPSGTGWTNLVSTQTGSAGQWVWWKIAAGGEGSITVTTDGAGFFGESGCVVFTGINTTTPLISHGNNTWSAVSHATVTSPSVNNTGTASACAVFLGSFYNGGAGSGQSTPTNMTLSYTAGANNSSSFGFYRLNAPTGAQSYATTASGGQIDWYGGDTLLFLAPASTAVSASAAKAAVTAAALAPTITDTVSVSAGIGSATASAKAPTVGIKVNAGKAAATVAALAPAGLTLAANAFADVAEAATDVGFAGSASDLIVDADLASATSDAYGASFMLTADAAAGIAEVIAGLDNPGTVGSGTNVLPDTAVASATVHEPGVDGVVAFARPVTVIVTAYTTPQSVEISDVVDAEVSAWGAVAQVGISPSAGLAGATASVLSLVGQSELDGQADVASVMAIAQNPSIVSSSSPNAGKAAASTSVKQVALGIGSGEPATVIVFAAILAATVHLSGGVSTERRTIRVGNTPERTYAIPHETRTKVVGRT